MGVSVKSSDDPGLTVTEIASTSEVAISTRRTSRPSIRTIDVDGPVAIGASADDSEVQDARGVRRAHPTHARPRVGRRRLRDQRVHQRRLQRDALWLQGIDWLTQPEDLVTAVPKFPKVRELELTQARSRYMLFLMAGVIPGLFLIAGALVWVLRRGALRTA